MAARAARSSVGTRFPARSSPRDDRWHDPDTRAATRGPPAWPRAGRLGPGRDGRRSPGTAHRPDRSGGRHRHADGPVRQGRHRRGRVGRAGGRPVLGPVRGQRERRGQRSAQHVLERLRGKSFVAVHF